MESIDYESFGAVGDGVADDLPAIVAAHERANQTGQPVRARADATYHLGARALTAVIATDTDWGTSRFTIDDSRHDIENHRAPLFEVRSLLPPEELAIERLSRDQSSLEVRPARDCHVRVESGAHRVYIRRGLNQNDGVAQHDGFVLRTDGTIDSPIDWDYPSITKVEARPIDEARLTLRGGVFTTVANAMRQEQGYNYWSRNIRILRSNTEVDGLTHYVTGETAVGHPYQGFLSVQQCADVTLRDCFVSGHKIYQTIGAAGKPVSMGSYDLSANDVVGLRLIGCRMNHILDRTRWGVIGSNFCKNILLEDCVLSRMDTHMGVSGTYDIRRCHLGHMGLNAIGRGTLTIEGSTLWGRNLVSFRQDYGSTWEGDVVVRDCRWVPAGGDAVVPHLIGVSNDGMHDFGYPCSMPRRVTVDGLEVDDAHHPDDYEGMFLFTDPDGVRDGVTDTTPTAERPFPYTLCEGISLRGLRTASGKPPRLCPNAQIAAAIPVDGD